MLEHGLVDVSSLVTHTFKLEEAEKEKERKPRARKNNEAA